MSVYHSKVKLKYIKQGFPFENFGGGGQDSPPPLRQVDGGGGEYAPIFVGGDTNLPI